MYVTNPNPTLFLCDNPDSQPFHPEYDKNPTHLKERATFRAEHEERLSQHKEALDEVLRNNFVRSCYSLTVNRDPFVDSVPLIQKVEKLKDGDVRTYCYSTHGRRAIRSVLQLLAVRASALTGFCHIGSATAGAVACGLSTLSKAALEKKSNGEDVKPNITRFSRGAIKALMHLGVVEYIPRLMQESHYLDDMSSVKDQRGARYMPSIFKVTDFFYEVIGISSERLNKERSLQQTREPLINKYNLLDEDEIKKGVVLSDSEFKRRHYRAIRTRQFDSRKFKQNIAANKRRDKKLEQLSSVEVKEVALSKIKKEFDIGSLHPTQLSKLLDEKIHEIYRIRNNIEPPHEH